MTFAIIPDGPIQFFQFELEISKLPRIVTQFVETARARPEDDGFDWHLTCLAKEDDKLVDMVTGQDLLGEDGSPTLDHPDQYFVSIPAVIQQFKGRWVPLPYLRLAGSISAIQRRFWPNSPTDWCRLYFTQQDVGVLRGVIAFDPRVEVGPGKHEIPSDEGFPTLAQHDVDEAGQFALASNPSDISWFLKLHWVEDWLKSFNKPRRGESLGSHTDHIAKYVALLELLENSQTLPDLRLTNPRMHKPVDVDLVLDIGNSRSIGMLIERRNGENSNLNDGAKLELRNLSNPIETFQETFSSTVCFAEARFGDPDGYSRASDRSRPAFVWPTLARAGAEAISLAAASKCDMGPTSMSSPKRYLWDLKSRNTGEEWRFSPGHSGREDPVNRGRFAAFINDAGLPLNQLNAPPLRVHGRSQGASSYPVTSPRFARSSLMMFLLAEIFQHAIVQINSPHRRNDRLNPDLPRKLRQIILTVPPAMTISERNLYEFWARAAIDTLWKALGWDTPRYEFQSKPIVQVLLDEASATQLVFVYNEIAIKFAGDSKSYFANFGKSQHSEPKSPALRVASIDIGGGTTDMVITTYLNHSQHVTSIISPHQEFRESFNFAGDDIIKVLIEKHILGEIVAKLKEAGRDYSQDFIVSRFGRNTVGLAQRQKNLRAQFTQQVLQPIALAILSALEAPHNGDASEEIVIKTADLFGLASISPEIEGYLEILSPNAQVWSVAAAEFHFKREALERSISAAISPYLNDLMEVVNQLNCDFMLITGRPSCLPAIQSIFFANPPIPPHRIIPMNKYKIGKWYPFLDLRGNIGDPKTTGVVGALLSAVSEGNMLNFHFRSRALKPASTINFIGPMELDRQILNQNLFFNGINLDTDREDEMEQVFPFASPVYIGFKQINVDRWKTTPLYYLSFSSQEAAARAVQAGLPYSLTLRYRRPGASETDGDASFHNEGIMEISEIVSANGTLISQRDIDITFKTLWDVEGHWLDTGLFDL
jgi:hypothetical protein